MTEEYIDEQQGSSYDDLNYSGTRDSDTNVLYNTKGQGPDHYQGTFVRPLFAVNEHIRVIRGFRVYSDSTDTALQFSITAGKFYWGGAIESYAGSVNNSLTDASTNYIYYDLLTSALVINTSGFPSEDEAPHLAIATIVTAAGAYDLDANKTDYLHEQVYQPHHKGHLYVTKHKVLATDLTAAATTDTKTLITLPAGAIVQDAFFNLTTQFSGTGLTDVDIDVGPSGSPTALITGTMNLTSDSVGLKATESFKGADLTNAGRTAIYSLTATTAIILTGTAVGANWSAISTGQVDVYLAWTVT